MKEYKLYIGLNDKDSLTQEFEQEKYIRVLENTCKSYRVSFCFSVIDGGYFYESGEFNLEKTLLLTFVDIDGNVVREIARDLCTFFNQEIILMSTCEVETECIRPLDIEN